MIYLRLFKVQYNSVRYWCHDRQWISRNHSSCIYNCITKTFILLLITHYFCFLPAPASHYSLSASVSLTVLEASDKWYYVVICPFHLPYFTCHDVLQVHACFKQQDFLLFLGWIIFNHMHGPHLLYPLIRQWTLKFLPCFGYCE